MFEKKETLIVEIADGLWAEVSVSIVEEALPTPHERDHHRLPTARELETVCQSLAARQYRFQPQSKP